MPHGAGKRNALDCYSRRGSCRYDVRGTNGRTGGFHDRLTVSGLSCFLPSPRSANGDRCRQTPCLSMKSIWCLRTASPGFREFASTAIRARRPPLTHVNQLKLRVSGDDDNLREGLAWSEDMGPPLRRRFENCKIHHRPPPPHQCWHCYRNSVGRIGIKPRMRLDPDR